MTASIRGSRFGKIFANSHVVLPVIHVSSGEQARRNATVARDAVADGIFLINHSIGSDELLQIHDDIAKIYPGWWVGVNCLDLDPERVFSRILPGVSGVWTDNAMIREGQDDQPDAERVLKAQVTNSWKGLYFGGVAFKYQRRVDDLKAAARIARRFMDVVTTSGITPGNVIDFLPCSDCYLVATGISRSFEELDPPLVRRLVKAVRKYDNEHGCIAENNSIS